MVVDVGASYDVTKHCQLYLNAENLTDERIETGRSADGIVNTGTPRLVLGGVRCQLVIGGSPALCGDLTCTR